MVYDITEQAQFESRLLESVRLVVGKAKADILLQVGTVWLFALVCVISYFYLATCGPTGHGSRGIAPTNTLSRPIGRDGTAETQGWSAARRFPGHIIVEERAVALQVASERRRRNTI